MSIYYIQSAISKQEWQVLFVLTSFIPWILFVVFSFDNMFFHSMTSDFIFSIKKILAKSTFVLPFTHVYMFDM